MTPRPRPHSKTGCGVAFTHRSSGGRSTRLSGSVASRQRYFLCNLDRATRKIYGVARIGWRAFLTLDVNSIGLDGGRTVGESVLPSLNGPRAAESGHGSRSPLPATALRSSMIPLGARQAGRTDPQMPYLRHRFGEVGAETRYRGGITGLAARSTFEAPANGPAPGIIGIG